jgi:hypothetical protein
MKPKTYTLLMVILLAITVSNSYASSDVKHPRKARVEMTEEQQAARIAEIRNRVSEIKAMDMSTLTKSERKALKKELRQMNKEARATRGVYLSLAAIIIIILLLILIL